MAIGWYSLNPNSPNIRILIQLHQAPSTTGEPSSQEVEGNHSLSNKKMKTRPDFKLKKLIVSWTTLCLPLIKKKKKSRNKCQQVTGHPSHKECEIEFYSPAFQCTFKSFSALSTAPHDKRKTTLCFFCKWMYLKVKMTLYVTLNR